MSALRRALPYIGASVGLLCSFLHPHNPWTPCNQGRTRLRSPVVGDADSVYYKRDTHINVQFSQVQLSQWAAGGQSSASMIAKLDQFWEYDGTNVGWDTEIHGAFGLLHRPDEDIILKTDDRIEVATKLRYRLKDKGALTSLGVFELNRTWFRSGQWRTRPEPSHLQTCPGIWWWPWAWTSSRPQPRPFFGTLHIQIHVRVGRRCQKLEHLACFRRNCKARSRWLCAPRSEGTGHRKRDIHGSIGFVQQLLEEPEAVDIFTDHVLNLKVNDWLSTTLGLTLIYDKVQLVLREPDLTFPVTPKRLGRGSA